MNLSNEILQHGLSIQLDGDVLKISPPERITPEVREYIRSNKDRIIEEIRNSVWEPELLKLIQWFEVNIDLLPKEPFVYHRGDYENLKCTFIYKTPEASYCSLNQAIADGPGGEHVKDGTLKSILQALNRLFGEERSHSPP